MDKKKLVIGIDIGGTNMKAVLFDGQSVLADYELRTPKDSQDHLLVMAKALIEPLKEKADETGGKLAGVGIGVAGVLDKAKSKVLWSPNLPIVENMNLAARTAEFLEFETKMDNDASCFLRAEAIVGAGAKYENIFSITLGTGIGGGWWVNGDIYEGSHGAAGEPGHAIVDFDEMMDLEQAYQKLCQNNPAHLAEEAYRGDVLAERSYQEIGRMLGVQMANIANLIDPEVFIIGGKVVESSDLFLPEAKKHMKAQIKSSEARKSIKILKPRHGHFAGAIGAALLFR